MPWTEADISTRVRLWKDVAPSLRKLKERGMQYARHGSVLDAFPALRKTIYSCRPHSAVRAHFLPTLLLSKFTVARTSDTLAGRGHGPCFVVPCGYAYHQQQYHHASQAFGSSSHWNRLELYRPPRRLLFYETRSILQLPKASALVAPGPS